MTGLGQIDPSAPGKIWGAFSNVHDIPNGNIIMGRHAGFLTAASMLGRRPDSDDGPHLIYVPEVPFSQEKFLADVDRVYTKHGRCLIAMSEGVHDADGTPLVVKADHFSATACPPLSHTMPLGCPVVPDV